MRPHPLARPWSAVLLLALAAGCGSSDDDGDDGPGDDDGGAEVQLTAEARLLENHPDFESVEVSAESLVYTFSSPAADVDAPEGSVLVGAASGGYVRRATQVSADGNTLELVTEDASLTDAIAEGDIDMPVVAPAADGWTPCLEGATCIEIDLIDLSDTELYDGEVEGVPLSVRIAQGGLRFSPAVDMDVSIGFPGRIKRFSAIVSGAFTADLEVEAVAGGPVEYSQEIDLSGPAKPLYAYPFTILVPTPLGPLPVVGTVNLDVFVGFRAKASATASVSTGVSASAELAVGAVYDGGDWTTQGGEPVVDATYQPIELDAEASASIEAYARPEVSVIFYGVAGPRVALEPLLRLTGTLAPPEPLHTLLEACLRGELGFSIKILSFELADFSTSIERCLTLFDSNQQASEALVIAGSDGAVTIDTDAGTIVRQSDGASLVPEGVTFAREAQGEGEPVLGAFGASAIDIQAGAEVSVVGGAALVLRSAGDVDIAGSIDLGGGRGSPETAGPGGSGGGVAALLGGNGAGPGGGGAPVPLVPDAGGGGGGHAAGGGEGGARGADPGGVAGLAVAPASSLVGGSGGGLGGGSGDGSGRGGGGGGGLRIEAAGAVRIAAGAAINAGGGGGEGGAIDDGGGGGGAGGTIDLSAASIDVSGTLAANGGGGGAGADLDQRGAGGQPGVAGAEPAVGGAAAGEGQGGGSGGAGDVLGGGAGGTAAAVENQDDNAGGGGGAAGRIFLRSRTVTGAGTISPAATPG